MKKENFIIVGITLIIVTISVSLAYFAAKIVGTPKDVSLSMKGLYVEFTDNTAELNASGITPGWTYEKTFTIENKSESDYKYNIIFKDLVNTFATDNLQYKVTNTSSNGGYSMSDFENIPKSETKKEEILAYSVSISSGVKQVYKLELRYLDSDEQNSDMGKKFSGKLFITEGTEAPSLYDKLLSDNPTRETRTDFSTTFTTTNTGTLYTSTEQIGTNEAKDVYYFAGDAKNNWVKFGTFASDLVRGYISATNTSYREYATLEECNSASSYNTNCSYVLRQGDPIYWRIIRTNHDKSIRLLYFGVSTDTTDGSIGEASFNENAYDPMNVGYKYGTSGSLENNRTNENDSTIKTYIDTWYKSNLINYTKFLSKDAVYCNNRNVREGQTYSMTSSFDFASVTEKPSYNCTSMSDAFSVNNANAKLDYPIALMTADEAVFAGGVFYNDSNNAPYAWYYVNSDDKAVISSGEWWLLSPKMWSYFRNPEDPSEPGFNDPLISIVYGGTSLGRPVGRLNMMTSAGDLFVRPVLSINSCVKYASGDGSPEKPYEILETENGC